eukprot:1256185-Rhodomonas_salina.1
MQETAFLVQTVPQLWFLGLDFGTYAQAGCGTETAYARRSGGIFVASSGQLHVSPATSLRVPRYLPTRTPLPLYACPATSLSVPRYLSMRAPLPPYACPATSLRVRCTRYAVLS